MPFILFETISQLNRENGEGSFAPGIRKLEPKSLGDLVIDGVFLEFL
jgi:hypothetical protein